MRFVRARGPYGPWQPLLQELERHGACVLYGAVEDWTPGARHAAQGLFGYAASSGSDRRRLERLRRPDLQARFAASRMLLTSAAGAALGVRADELELAHEPGGRPRLRGIGQLEISLSHTGTLIVVALSWYGRVGVDVEAADRPMLELGTERQMCVPEELRLLRSLAEEDRNRALTRLWTLKEAYSKAIGQGLRFPFTEFGFDFSGGGQARLLRCDGIPVDGGEWAFHSRLVEGTHWVSGAFHDPGFGGEREGRGAQARPLRHVHSRSSSH